MRVIVKEARRDLGAMGDEIEVANGYARNYLIPRKFAIEATSSNRIAFSNLMSQKKRKHDVAKNESMELAEKIEKLSLTFVKKAGEGDKLFGSVTSQEVADKLKENGFDIDKRKINLVHSVKKIGTHKISIDLPSSVTASINIEVKREEEPKEEVEKEEKGEAESEVETEVTEETGETGEEGS